jgi:hypothetical protein
MTSTTPQRHQQPCCLLCSTASITQEEYELLQQLPALISNLDPTASDESHHGAGQLLSLLPLLLQAVVQALQKLQFYLAETVAVPFHSIRHIRACILLLDSAAACMSPPGVCKQWLQQDGDKLLQGTSRCNTVEYVMKLPCDVCKGEEHSFGSSSSSSSGGIAARS